MNILGLIFWGTGCICDMICRCDISICDIWRCPSYLWHMFHSYLWHCMFTCVLPICGIHTCHSYLLHMDVSFLSVTHECVLPICDICVIPIYDMICSYVSFLSLKIHICHSYLLHMDVSLLSVTHECVLPICDVCVIPIYDMICSHVSFLSVTFIYVFIFVTYGCWIPVCDTWACHSHLWDGMIICVIAICDMCVIPIHDIIYSHVSFLSVIFMYILIFVGYFLQKGPISSGSLAERVLKFMWASDIHMCHSYLWHVCHSYLWHNTFTCVLPICGVHICRSYGVATISRLLKIIGLFAKEPIKQMIFCTWDL